MLNLQVHARSAPVQAFLIDQGCTIGKDPGCDIVVRGMLVGKLHARIVQEHNAYYIEDQGGIAATLVNGSPITRYGPLTEADQIEIGTTTLKITRAAASHAVHAAPPATFAHPPAIDADLRAATAFAQPETLSSAFIVADTNTASQVTYTAPQPQASEHVSFAVPAANQRSTGEATPGPAAPAPAQIQPARAKKTAAPILPVAPINSPAGIELRKRAHMKVIAALDLRRLNVARMEDDELRKTVNTALDEIFANDSSFRTTEVPIATLKKSVFDEIIGLGPLEELIADPTVSEIMVNCHDEIFVEQSGRLTRSPVIFTDDRAVLGAIERIVAPIGRRIDESSPMVDARLSDGSRVNAIIPPLALKGPSITIRKFSQRKTGRRGPDQIWLNVA